MQLNIKSKYALVTGGTHGIGRAIAHALADEGVNVAVFSRTKERVDQMREELSKKDVKSLVFQADVFNRSDIHFVQDEIIKNWGTIDIVINNVGGGGRWGNDNVETTNEKVWYEVYEKNALATVRFTNWAIPYMREKRWGRIVTITSIFGREAGGRPWFSMAKTAQTSLMKALAKKSYLSSANITFNSVAPGAIIIPNTGWEKMQKETPDEYNNFINEKLPLKRLGTPEEVASVVTFLCSEAASLVNGASISVDGGQSYSNL